MHLDKSQKTEIFEKSEWKVFVVVLLFFLEEAMATHSSTLAWKILWTEVSGRLQSMGSLRVGHD